MQESSPTILQYKSTPQRVGVILYMWSLEKATKMHRIAIVSKLLDRTGGSTQTMMFLLISKLPMMRLFNKPLRVFTNWRNGYGIREYLFIKTEERRLLRDARQLDRRDWFYDCGVVPEGWTLDHLVGLLVNDPLAERRLTQALVVAACEGTLMKGSPDSIIRLPELLDSALRRNSTLADMVNYSPPKPPASYIAEQIANGTSDEAASIINKGEFVDDRSQGGYFLGGHIDGFHRGG